MFKRKSLTALIAVMIMLLAFITPYFCVKGTAMADGSAEAAKVTAGFEFDESGKVITGFALPESVKGEFEVIIPDGVTEIQDNVFGYNTKLVGVTLNKELKTIGDYAFAQTSVTEITIPKSVTKIGEHAFNGAKLTSVTFENGRTEALTVSSYAFANCTALPEVSLPDNTTAGQYAFNGCNSLLWVYVGNNCSFKNSAGIEDPAAVFFPVNSSVTIIFPSKGEYDKVSGWTDKTFANKHLSAATYIVKVNCFVGSGETGETYNRLHGKSFNYVPDKTTGAWNTDTAYDKLPAQASHYSETTWYSDKALTNKVTYQNVNELLASESVINLYCHETITVPVFPAEPVSWVYKSDVSYDINKKSEVLQALGCEQEFTAEQLDAINFAVSFADGNGNVAEKTPAAICENGTYSVSLSLNPDFGNWSQDITSQVTVNVDTNPFTIVMIVLLVVGVLAVIVTVTTAIIRKKVQERNKRKQLTQKEIIEKFKANGGETTLG